MIGTEEIGLGGTECNDGLDNDSDGAVDAEDADCVAALDNAEEAEGSGDAGGTDTGSDTGDGGGTDTGSSGGGTGG